MLQVHFNSDKRFSLEVIDIPRASSLTKKEYLPNKDFHLK